VPFKSPSDRKPKCSKGFNSHYTFRRGTNKWNPNPNKMVYYGEMTWEEMMFPFFGVVVDMGVDPSKILAPGRSPVPPGA